MITDCSHPRPPDYQPCAYCQLAHEERLERLRETRNDAVTMATVASWAIHGVKQERERVWWAT